MYTNHGYGTEKSKSCRFCYSSVAMVGRCGFPFLLQEHKYNCYVYLHTVYSDSTYLTQFGQWPFCTILEPLLIITLKQGIINNENPSYLSTSRNSFTKSYIAKFIPIVIFVILVHLESINPF